MIPYPLKSSPDQTDGSPEYFSILLMLILLFTGPATAQHTGADQENTSSERKRPEPNQEQKKQIRKLISKLSATAYRVRQNAQEKLIEIGTPALPLLKKHLSTENPETRNRLLHILKTLGAWQVIPELAKKRVRRYEKLFGKEKYFYKRENEMHFRSWSFEEEARKVFGPNAPRDPSEYLSPPIMMLLLKRADRSNETLMKNIGFLYRYGPSETAANQLAQLAREENGSSRNLLFDSLMKVIPDQPSAAVKRMIRNGMTEAPMNVKRKAMKLAVHLPRNQSVPILLDALESERAEIRYQAYFSLREITGKNIYFNAWWNPERRKEKVRAWRDWWNRYRNQHGDREKKNFK